MATTPIKRAVIALGAVASVVALVSIGVLPHDLSVALDDAAQFLAGLAAAVTCWFTARHRVGPERGWRVLMAAGIACWSAGVLTWGLYRSVLDVPLPSPSLADFGFFLLPVFAVPALLTLVGQSSLRRESGGATYAWTTSLLDGMVIVGSLFVLSWSTVLGAVARSTDPDALGFLVAVMYPITDLVLLAMVGLLALVPKIVHLYRTQLAFLAAGLVCIAVSDSLYAYLVAVGAEQMPLIADAGFIAGPVCIALAAASPPADLGDTRRRGELGTESPVERHAGDRLQFVVPYALMAAVGLVVGVQRLAGGAIDSVVLGLFFAVVVLSVVRQVLTLLQNDALLRRLSDTQAELTFRAHHDGLTGLLNRSAFDDRLGAAIERHNSTGHIGVLLLIDLDDFKSINDRLGHGAGDRTLKTLSTRLSTAVENGGNGGVVARFGGDEFTVLIPAGIDAGCRMAKSIVDAIRAPQDIEGRVVTIGASVGVVELDVFDGDVTADVLLRHADRAMYEAKKNGKAGVFAYDSDGTLRLVYNLANTAAPFDWWSNGDTPSRQGSRGINPNMVAGEPDPARLIGPPTRT